MRLKLVNTFHFGWRQIIGVFLIIVGIVGSIFYRIELQTINSSALASSEITNATPMATDVPSPAISPSIIPSPVNKIVKLSTATQAELETLPKIGLSKAKAIIDYRNTHGFKKISDLEKVKGIGPKTVELLRPLVEL